MYTNVSKWAWKIHPTSRMFCWNWYWNAWTVCNFILERGANRWAIIKDRPTRPIDLHWIPERHQRVRNYINSASMSGGAQFPNVYAQLSLKTVMTIYKTTNFNYCKISCWYAPDNILRMHLPCPPKLTVILWGCRTDTDYLMVKNNVLRYDTVDLLALKSWRNSQLGTAQKWKKGKQKTNRVA